jgi:allantoicase
MSGRKRKRSKDVGDRVLKLSRNDSGETENINVVKLEFYSDDWRPTSVSFDGVHIEFGCLDPDNRKFWICTVNTRTLQHKLKSIDIISKENNLSHLKIWFMTVNGVACFQRNGKHKAF